MQYTASVSNDDSVTFAVETLPQAFAQVASSSGWYNHSLA